MLLETWSPPERRLAPLLERLLRPAIGFNRPSDVLKDQDLSTEDKRAILATWAGDGCAVEGRPQLRWMIGSDDPVPLDEVLEALARLDSQTFSGASSGPGTQGPVTQTRRGRRSIAPPKEMNNDEHNPIH